MTKVSIRRGAADALIDLAPGYRVDSAGVETSTERRGFDGRGRCRTCPGRFGPEGQSFGTRSGHDALARGTLRPRSTRRRLWRPSVRRRATATRDLARALADPVPGVRWAAGEALASIGPAAHSAVPQLIEALQDEFLYVRICAAGALGSIGPEAQMAREALRLAANDPALRDEAEWALNRIAGVESGEPVVSPVRARAFRRAPTGDDGGSNGQSSG